jgi:hypothetical protein
MTMKSILPLVRWLGFEMPRQAALARLDPMDKESACFKLCRILRGIAYG